MTFQTKIKQENYFLSQPHQPFFTLGIVNSVIFMLIFALNYKGVIFLHISTPVFHVYSMIFLIFTNFFTGFLFTTFPRFTQAKVISKGYYTNIFYANTFGTILFLIGSFVSLEIVIIAMFCLLISQIFMLMKLQFIYNRSYSQNKKDPFWILTALYFGIVGHFLFILFVLDLVQSKFAINLSFYMYLIFLAFTIAQRMIPFFSNSLEPKNTKFISTVFVLLILKTISISFESFWYVKAFEIVLDICISLYTLKEFLRWKLHPFNSPAILWVLHLGLFWLPTAFLISAFSKAAEMFLNINFYFMGIHLVALGFLSTIFIGFGTRVVLGHSGGVPSADKFTRNIFFAVQAIVIMRMLYSINVAFGWNLNFLFDITFSIWLLVFIIWGYKYGKILIFKK